MGLTMRERRALARESAQKYRGASRRQKVALLEAFVGQTQFCDAIPFYRQEKQFARIVIELSRVDFCNWAVQAAGQCDPLIELFLDEIRAGLVMQMDGARLQVMKELGRADTAQSFMWVMRGGPPGKPVILYRYHPSRSASIPLQYLSGYKGHLQTDGYEGYAEVGSLPGIVHVGCWAHARRKFDEPAKSSKKAAALMKPWGGLERSIASRQSCVLSSYPPRRFSGVEKGRSCRFCGISKSGLKRKLSKFRPRFSWAKR